MKINASFERKPFTLKPHECVIEKVIEIDHALFTFLLVAPYRSFDFIKDNFESQYVDQDDTRHALLVLDRGSDDGVLINGEGAAYARYACFAPNIRFYIDSQIQKLVHELIDDTQKNLGELVVSSDCITKRLGTISTWDSWIGNQLICTLNAQNDIASVCVDNDNLRIITDPDLCYSNSQEKDTFDLLIKG